MKKTSYKIKSWVLGCIYLFSIGAIIVSLFMLNRVLNNKTYSNEILSYVYKGLFENVTPVVKTYDDNIIKPFDGEGIEVLKYYYDKDSLEDVQEKSLILYQDTYMPNTGILYGSDASFDVIAVADGTVADVVADEIMGNIVTIKHSNNLTTIYHCLNEVIVLTGDIVNQGDLLGTSGLNKIEYSKENMLLFEVIYNGEYLNPESVYGMSIKEFS